MTIDEMAVKLRGTTFPMASRDAAKLIVETLLPDLIQARRDLVASTIEDWANALTDAIRANITREAGDFS